MIADLTPRWEFVQRMYYRSGHVEMKKTEKMISEGKWLEAAAIWKANIDNKNKNIAAKSMFNLAPAKWKANWMQPSNGPCVRTMFSDKKTRCMLKIVRITFEFYLSENGI